MIKELYNLLWVMYCLYNILNQMYIILVFICYLYFEDRLYENIITNKFFALRFHCFQKSKQRESSIKILCFSSHCEINGGTPRVVTDFLKRGY